MTNFSKAHTLKKDLRRTLNTINFYNNYNNYTDVIIKPVNINIYTVVTRLILKINLVSLNSTENELLSVFNKKEQVVF